VILVDTSIWIDHFRSRDLALDRLLDQDLVLAHPFVTGKIALGSLARRAEVLAVLQGLTQAKVAGHDEVASMIERHGLFGAGIGYVDAHLRAAVRLTPGAGLWTRDKRLAAAAERLKLAGGSPVH